MRDELIEKLNTMKKNLSNNVKVENADKLKYMNLRKYFRRNAKDTEQFVVSCIRSDESETSLQCLASVSIMLEKLEQSKEVDLARIAKEKKYRDYYRKFFQEHQEKVDEILNGRCKVLFSDPWYGHDLNTKDAECEAALLAKNQREKQKQLTLLEKEKSKIKDMAYFKVNIDEAKVLSTQCKEGVINDLPSCEFALQVTQEREENIKKRQEYYDYYSGHLLAARFHLRWCKSVMLDFDAQCQVVSNLLANHKDKEKNVEKFKKYTQFFRRNPFEAKVIVEGDCKDKLQDSWYYLDKNIQTERCDAAIEAVQ